MQQLTTLAKQIEDVEQRQPEPHRDDIGDVDLKEDEDVGNTDADAKA